MRKIFGIVAIALLLVAPAFGQNTASIKYYLQLQAGDANGGSQPFVGGSETDGLVIDPAEVDKVTWSVRAVASGQYNSVDILGAANLVWDLALTKVGETVTVGDTGSACPVFGLGSDSTTGFYSVWNPGGGGGIPLEAAAFAFQAFGLGDPATVADPVALGGPNMERYQYPSTYQWMGGHGPADPPVGGQVNTLCTAKSGTLMGMGAGYSQYVNHFLQDPEFNTEMGGVAGGNCSLLSGYDSAGGHIIAEGQMNLAGLPGGQYELKLIPGRGNNVLRGDLFACDEYELAGPFAGAGVYDVNANGDTILFEIQPQIVEPAPIASAAASVKTHGTAGTFPIALPLTGTAGVECRNGGPTTVVVTYGNVDAIAGTPVVTAVNANVVGASMATNQLTINLNGAADRTCVAITINGVANAADPTKVADQHVIKVTSLIGDVDNSHAVNAADISAVTARSSFTLVNQGNFWYDLDCNGRTQAADISVVTGKSRFGTITCAN